MPSFRVCQVSLAIALASTFTAATSVAVTPEEKAGARAAAESGGEAFEAGRYEEAIDYFTRAESLVHAPPHLLFLARAELKLGHLVAAREFYLKLDQEDLPPGSPQIFKDSKKMAQDELAALEPRLPFVSVVVQGASNEPVEVLRDGKPMPRALVGIPQPMDPGEHSFQATAPGMASSVQKVIVKERTKETVLLTLAPVSADNPAPATAGGTSAAGTSTTDATKDEGGGWSAYRIGGFAALGVGVAGATVGTIFLVQGLDSYSQSDTLFESCTSGGACDEARINELDSDGNTQTTIGAIGLGVGGAALITGAILLIVDPGTEPKPATASVRPWFGGQMVGVRGTF